MVTGHPPRALFVLGTRPEAIKLAPVVRAAREHRDWDVVVCNTGQHRELLAPMLDVLDLRPDITLEAMRPGQGLNALLATLLTELSAVFSDVAPDMVVAQGDTTTVLASALAAHHARIPIAHVEAGLRTGDLAAPFPEEANRVLVGRLAELHLAPTPRAADNLLSEGVDPEQVLVTGNTVVDALNMVRQRLPARGAPPPSARRWAHLGAERRMILVTGHRRESFGGGLDAVCDALLKLARAHPDVDIVYPVHLNPAVTSLVEARLGGVANVHRLPPLDYPAMVWMMDRASFVITDSGGIQEEAPELGKPVLVTRASTERGEAVEQGSAVVVGYDATALVTVADQWLRDPAALEARRPGSNPFGDGRAGPRCVAAMRRALGLPHAAVEPWLGASRLRRVA